MKRKIAAILAADVVGYSRLTAEDEEDALRRLAVYQSVFSDFVARFGGNIFNTAGDAILAEFQSAVDAVRCSVDLQESIRARNLAYPPSRQMSFRIGVTIGDVVERNGDLLGEGVNIASRLEGLAPVGGICISRSVYEAVANKLSIKFVDAGRKHLKNIPEPVHAYTVIVEPPNAARAPVSARSTFLRRNAWLAGSALVILAAGFAGFFAYRGFEAGPKVREADVETSQKSAGTSTPSTQERLNPTASIEPETAGDAAPKIDETKPFPLPTSDPVAQQAVIKRQWNNCLEGSEPIPTVAACRAVIAYKISSGDQLALVYQKLGRAQRENEATDDAIDAYDESIRLAPSAATFNDRGIAYFDKQQWDKAIADYTEAIRLDADFGEAYNNRAWTRLTAGQASAALDDANAAVRLLPTKSYAWDTRGHINEDLGHRDAAIRDYREALKLDPSYGSSRQGLQRLGASP